MFGHHHHSLQRELLVALHEVAAILKRLEKAMTDQEHLDSVVAALQGDLKTLTDKIAALEAQLAAVPPPAAPLNFAAADALVAQANTDAAAAAPPAAPAA
jgi:peptidoglycan hydrolase CwlO-like protein